METKVGKPSKQIKNLIIINNDRYEGYKTAAKETKDSDLKNLFIMYSNQSKQFGSELQQALPDFKYTPTEGETKNTGKFYRVFMDIRNALNGGDRKGILSSCEFGEDQAKKEYDDVLKEPENMDNHILNIVQRQRGELQQGHDKIKAIRDSAK